MRPFAFARRWLVLTLILMVALGVGPVAAQDEGTPVAVAEETATATSVAESETPIVEEPGAETPVVEEPVAEEPVVEEPVVEEPVTEEPVVDEGQTDEASEGEGEAVEDVEPAAEPFDITVSVTVYECATDPAGDPAASAECSLSEGIGLNANVDGEPIGSATTTGGVAAFAGSAAAGSFVGAGIDLSTLPAGYSPLGSGYADALVEVGSTAYAFTFVNLVEPLVGRLQIASGSCKSATESGWSFVRVIQPRIAAQADDPECGSLAGARFTITGGTLGAGIVAVTDGDGSWPGTLPAGDYTVTADDGAATDVAVLLDETTFVLAVNYSLEPLAVLVVSRFSCEAEAIGFEFTISGTAPTIGGGDGCSAIDGDFLLESSGGVTASAVRDRFGLGRDGYRELTLEPGSYVLTDLASGETTSFDLSGGSALFALVQLLELVDNGGGNPGGGNSGGGHSGGDPGGGSTGGSGTDGGGNAPGTTGGGSGGTGGTSSAAVGATASDGTAGVTTLPQTGARTPSSGGVFPQIALLVALVALLALFGLGAVAKVKGTRA